MAEKEGFEPAPDADILALYLTITRILHESSFYLTKRPEALRLWLWVYSCSNSSSIEQPNALANKYTV